MCQMELAVAALHVFSLPKQEIHDPQSYGCEVEIIQMNLIVILTMKWG